MRIKTPKLTPKQKAQILGDATVTHPQQQRLIAAHLRKSGLVGSKTLNYVDNQTSIGKSQPVVATSGFGTQPDRHGLARSVQEQNAIWAGALSRQFLRITSYARVASGRLDF